MIREDLRTYLLTKSGLTSLITGTDGNVHLYLSRIPQGSSPLQNYPAVVYQRTVGGHLHDLDGSAGVAESQFQFASIGVDPVVVENVAEQVRLALQGYRGAMGSSTIGRLTLDDESDDSMQSPTGADTIFYWTTMTFTITYYETIPTFS